MYNICMQLQVAEREVLNENLIHSDVQIFVLLKVSECPVKGASNQRGYGSGTLYWDKKSLIDGFLAQTYLPYD